MIEIKSAPRVYGSGAKLARQFGISQAVVSEIRSGKLWKEVRADESDSSLE